jgi:hypothetical protein
LHSYTEYIFGREKQVNAHSFGNVFKEPLYEIWNSSEYTLFRYIVGNALFPFCTDCPLRDSCDLVQTTDSDCFGNTPSCGDCLWAKGIIRCPWTFVLQGKRKLIFLIFADFQIFRILGHSEFLKINKAY